MERTSYGRATGEWTPVEVEAILRRGMRNAAAGSLALLGLVALGAGGCRKKDQLPATPYPKAKLAYRVGNCVYMDLDHAGEPEKGVCYGNPGDVMMVADFDGNGTADLAVRREGQLLIDTRNEGEAHDSFLDLGDVGGARGFLVADFSGSARRREPASVCVIHDPGETCRIQGTPAARATEHRLLPGLEPFAGRWRPLGPARLGVRTGNCVRLDEGGDERPDKDLCYQDLGSIDQVLVGDWNGDGRDDLVLRRGPCVFVDTRLDGTHTETQCLGEDRGATDYFVGSWDGK
jgi:hypothetical protein